jgi:hypothetical chaperone protein
MIETGLRPLIGPGMLTADLWPMAARIGEAARETLTRAGLTPEQVDRVIFVGGSSLVQTIDQLMRATFPNAQFEYSEVFTAVVDGLAIGAGRLTGLPAVCRGRIRLP